MGGYGAGADLALSTYCRYEGENPLGGILVIDGMVPLYKENILSKTMN